MEFTDLAPGQASWCVGRDPPHTEVCLVASHPGGTRNKEVQ